MADSHFATHATHADAHALPLRIRSKRNRDSPISAGGLLSYDALPEYLKDNDYIRGHYRPVLGLSESVWSLFGIHNETGNIYTHLLGFFIFVALTIYVARLPPTPTEKWPMFAFMVRGNRLANGSSPVFLNIQAGAMFCFLCSSVCHLFGCCQKHVALFVWRFDYVGQLPVGIVYTLIECTFYLLLCH